MGAAKSRFTPRTDTVAGRRLAAGALTVTVASRRTGQHVTVRFCAKRRDRRWERCPFAQATHVFIDALDGSPVGTFHPGDGTLRFAADATPAVRWAATGVLRALCGRFPGFSRHATMYPMVRCRRCRRPLTDPESIERGVGPECFGEPTRSRAVPIAA